MLQNVKICPGVTVKYSPETVLAGIGMPDGMFAEVTVVALGN